MASKATDWMAGSVGVSSHWTASTVNADGSMPAFDDAVAAFDAERYAETLAKTGASHCIFTLAHARQFLPLPLPALDRILPGRTARRDLVGDLIDALRRRGIRFIAYYNHSCNAGDDPEWKKACGYADGIAGDLDRFAWNICSIVEGISRRYGDGIDGWWFDSAYSVDPRGPANFISCDIGGWRFPWAKLAASARSGNKNSAVAVNPGAGSRFAYFDDFDYYPGESVRLDEKFKPRALPGKRDHRWICIDSPDWVLTRDTLPKGLVQPRFTEEEVAAYIARHVRARRMVTFNILIEASGRISARPLAALARAIGSSRSRRRCRKVASPPPPPPKNQG